MNTGDGFQHICSTGSHTSPDLGLHLILRLSSLIDNSFCHADRFRVPENLAIEAFGCASKFAGALFLRLSTGSSYKQSGSSKSSSGKSCTKVKGANSYAHGLCKLNIRPTANFRPSGLVSLTEALALSVRNLLKEFRPLNSRSVLSLAAALVPSMENLSSKVHAIPLENTHDSINRLMGQASSVDDCQGCRNFSLSRICWTRDRVEPMTGIVFPTFLRNGDSRDHFHQSTEVLVGTGARSMNIIKFKSLKLYAFGFYIQPDSICEQLGSKYSSVPASELKNHSQFFEDLLRADIDMTVRLVVNYNGIKITAVKDAFEKSLRTRLEKMNPEADYQSLNMFGSYFTPDIPLPVGTIIDFRQTAFGTLTTEIGGKPIGAVQSKDLCRAFFDMYIGESPVSMKAKEEVAENLADLIRRC